MIKYLSVLLSCLLLAACSAAGLQYEFYRGEIVYLHKEANKRYKQGEYDKAKDHFEKIVALVPDYAEAHASLGNIALATGEKAEAEQYFAKASSIKAELAAQTQNSRAYLATVPGKQAQQSLYELNKLMAQAMEGNKAPFFAFVNKIETTEEWVFEGYRSSTESNEEISKYFRQLLDDNSLKACSRCQILAGFWLLKAPENQDFARVYDVILKVENESEAPALAHALGVAYERAGDRVTALNIYLRYPDDPRIAQRLY